MTLRLLVVIMYSGTQHFDEIIENMGDKDDIRDKTIEQIDDNGMEDAEMESFDDENYECLKFTFFVNMVIKKHKM